jgi:threonine/homoserine/homoserine lactone efflux protein
LRRELAPPGPPHSKGGFPPFRQDGHSNVVTIAVVQLITLIFAGLALLMGAYLLIIGRRPWRTDEETHVAPRVRLLGLSYILVFGSAMVQIISQPRGLNAEILGGLMVLGGIIVIVVVFLEARASRRSIRRGRLGD